VTHTPTTLRPLDQPLDARHATRRVVRWCDSAAADGTLAFHSVYNGVVRLAVNVIWLLLIVGTVILVWQSVTGADDVPILRDLRALVPLGQTQQVTDATPGPPPPTIVAKPSAAASPTALATELCAPTAPRFLHGAAALRAAIGTGMGEPVECEKVIDSAGDTEQKTTSGLAYYRARSNLPAFTNGFDHWALTGDGVAHWTGDDLEPPPNAELLR
jgi:hypothetical protein